MLCRLRGVPVESVLPLRLSGGAFAVWSQLPAHSQSSLVAVRGALYAAFALDQHAAYEAFSARRLRPGESADVFLADLRRLAALFGGLPERALTCAFVAGLPDDVRQTIRAGSKAEGLDLTTIVVRARAILSTLSGALPITRLRVEGRECSVLIDTGSTENIIYAPLCTQWRPRQVRVTTISGGQLECCGVGAVVVEAPTGHRGTLETVVVEKRPLGVDMVLGIAGVSALGGVTVLSPSEVRFCGAVCSEPLGVDAPDFRVCFDSAERRWTVAWKWRDGEGPECLTNTVAQYTVPSAARREYDAELDAWIAQGWLVPYDEDRHGAAKGLVPLMAVQQSNKAKVRPVMDYRELNGFVSAHTADADVCADQLRKWRRHGANVAVIDLKRAYLQVHVEERLWPYQTVMVRGQRFCLTRLGFGLNTAPQIMKAVVRSVLEQDPDVQRAVLPYVDDLLVNEDVLSADSVVAHFEKFGLNCKPPERAASGARLLGLRVQAEGGKLQWTRDNAVGAPPAPVTRRAVFSWCGRLVAHLPVCGWLRPAVAWLKRRVNQMTRAWDDVTDDAALRAQLDYVAGRLNGDDPARGTWCVEGDAMAVWTDASSLATGVVLESADGDVIEDACWLRHNEATHINMAELDAAIRGVNLAVAWGARTIDLRTDSATVHRWLDDAISGRARLRTKAHGELLIRRRVGIICQLVGELQLRLSVTLVRSAENRADALTRVPKDWLRNVSVTRECESPSPGVSAAVVSEPPPLAGAAAGRADGGTADELRAAVCQSHDRAGHPGVRRTLYFARPDVSRDVTRAMARAVVENCDACRSIDPAPVRWRHGSLGVSVPWQRISIDVTHHRGHNYLTVIDCGPSRFCVWRSLRRANAIEIDSDGDSDSVDDGDGDSDSVDDEPPLYVDCHWEATEDGADAAVDNGTTVRAVPETLQHTTEQTGTEPPAAEPAVAEPPAAEPAQVEPVLLRRSARLQSRMVR
ncbi:uncharacterized protein LOC122388597 [Amphibalanus amphitrite]|uniref:uncharacterized protein LOC122388597 n=1 Tax=Amphibalanus amphitrite TaxID=1232801 RepID=UPI001C928B61|nr:uncharacterized protein LOC122388597 [Amphibalanus amphitrite]